MFVPFNSQSLAGLFSAFFAGSSCMSKNAQGLLFARINVALRLVPNFPSDRPAYFAAFQMGIFEVNAADPPGQAGLIGRIAEGRPVKNYIHLWC